jgi:hypothetical protein
VSVEGHLDRLRGHAEGLPGVGGAEEVPSRPGKAADVLSSVADECVHMHKATLFVTLRKQKVVVKVDWKKKTTLEALSG